MFGNPSYFRFLKQLILFTKYTKIKIVDNFFFNKCKLLLILRNVFFFRFLVHVSQNKSSKQFK